MASGPRLTGATATLSLTLFALTALEAQNKQRKTELYLDSLPADSVSCGGLTVQFARFFKDQGEVKLLGANEKGTDRKAIDIWITNRSDSARTYEPGLFAALDLDGGQINFWSADQIASHMGGRGFLFKAQTEEEQRIQRETSESNQRETGTRPEYASAKLLPGATGGRRILVPDNDKRLDKGVTLYCGEQRLGLLHKPKKKG